MGSVPTRGVDTGDVRLRLDVRGAVQGVGFRPFVHRLASEEHLPGWVRNTADGVTIEVEGPSRRVDRFRDRLAREVPPLAELAAIDEKRLPPLGHGAFEIRESRRSRGSSARVLPDVATCPDCLREILDPGDRRHRYPFTNCTNCGPRFSILESLPYDRERTSMRGFRMCPACEREYHDPTNRRFHAQPNACPDCGPRLEVRTGNGAGLARDDAALAAAVEALRGGRIVAVKAIGGFHLMVDAASAAAVDGLRRRKRRPDKPLAVLAPSLPAVRELCRVDDAEATLLASPAAPIVLLRRREEAETRLAPGIAPGNPTLGVMLPSNPLQHLLMADLDRPIVATSGNLADEPLCIDDEEARERLGGIADLFLGHDRPIVRPLDDSVARVVAGRPAFLRCARGYAPLTLPRPESGPPTLAVGAHQKSTIAVAYGDQVVVSQHLGDLDTRAADENFRRAVASLERLYEVRPTAVVCDRHPDYRSTRFAEETGLPRTEVLHHAAHVFACAAENGVTGPALGVAWDGTGLGADGTIWGGEFFAVEGREAHRVAHLRGFPLPGGDVAAREPRRSALGLLWGRFSGLPPALRELAPIRSLGDRATDRLVAALARGLRTPLTTSAGRLFDAVASLADVRQVATFEGQAAMELEFAAARGGDVEPYPLAVRSGVDSELVVDWEPLVDELLHDVRKGAGADRIAARFHGGLVEAIVEVARRVGRDHVLLGGGCFQNAWLTERLLVRLRAEGFHGHLPRKLPPNDGAIAYGQIVAGGDPRRGS